MIHQLDPHTPLVWRGPHSLQLGVSRHPRVLDDVSPTAERLIGALIAGASHARLHEIARRTGDGRQSVTHLLDAVQAHVVDPTMGPAPLASTLDCGAELRCEASRVLARDLHGRVSECEPGGAGVMCAEFVPQPEQVSAWMSSGYPHGIVEFDDDGALVSAPVRPGITPCGRCRYLARVDDDPAWAALASQLSSRRATRVSNAIRVAAVIIALSRVDAVLQSSADGPSTSTVEFTTDTRLRSDGTIHDLAPAQFHPRCGCQTRQ